MTVTIDTNVLVYAADPNSGERHEPAIALVQRLMFADSVLCLQVLAELFHVLTRKVKLDREYSAAIVRRWQRAFPVIAADGSALDEAMWAVEAHNLSFWDAMLWATAKAGGCRVLLSEDLQNGRKLGGVNIVNPFDPENERLLDVILPDVEEGGL